MKKESGNRKDAEWAEAKRLCRLTAEDVFKAKQLSLNPRSLIKNRPSKSQLWKAPVHLWVRALYERMLERSARKRERKANQTVTGERQPAVAPEPRTVKHSRPEHQRAAHPLIESERTHGWIDSDLVDFPHPVWTPKPGAGNDCPF